MADACELGLLIGMIHTNKRNRMPLAGMPAEQLAD
jgi:hypothetical protein